MGTLGRKQAMVYVEVFLVVIAAALALGIDWALKNVLRSNVSESEAVTRKMVGRPSPARR